MCIHKHFILKLNNITANIAKDILAFSAKKHYFCQKVLNNIIGIYQKHILP